MRILRAEFEAIKRQWLAWDKGSVGTPGLFKFEWEGSRMIALCARCYFVHDQDSEKEKLSTKACQRGKTTSLGSVSRRRSTAVLIEQKTEDFLWSAPEGWLLMRLLVSSRSWA